MKTKSSEGEVMNLLDFFAMKMATKSRTKVWQIKSAGLGPKTVKIGGSEAIFPDEQEGYLEAVRTGKIDLSTASIRAGLERAAVNKDTADSAAAEPAYVAA
jgi:hypothetical protein